ncbi:MAG: hypothetical protein AMJ92_04075 [candidate division Zixibacteria bacterium SM23_81]|nr:MAG: hypothetical protein AMJ92_04075 [candidate division Zixibacteria bacterium SM23_81]
MFEKIEVFQLFWAGAEPLRWAFSAKIAEEVGALPLEPEFFAPALFLGQELRVAGTLLGGRSILCHSRLFSAKEDRIYNNHFNSH